MSELHATLIQVLLPPPPPLLLLLLLPPPLLLLLLPPPLLLLLVLLLMLPQEGFAFEIVAFPCNQFGAQEPGTNHVNWQKHATQCSSTYTPSPGNKSAGEFVQRQVCHNRQGVAPALV
jgi:hypothetical protein